MAQSSSKFFVLGCITAIFTLTALGFVIYHSNAHCSYTESEGSSKTCSIETIEACPPAFRVYTLISQSGSISESTVTCPWRDGTSILGFASLGLVQVFLLLFVFRMRKNVLNVPVSVLAIIVVGSLLATMILMIVDMSDGHKASKEIEEGKESYRPSLYIVNTILVFLGIIMVAIMAALGRKIVVEEQTQGARKTAANTPQVPTTTSTPQISAETSRSGIDKNSIYMVNGYSGLNSDWISRSNFKSSSNPYMVRQY